MRFLRNVRLYSFDVLNGINTVVEFDIVGYNDMLFGVEEYGGHSATEAFSKFLQVHHGSWCFPWMAYRVAGDVVRIARGLGSEAGAILSYYAVNNVPTAQSADAQFVDLYLGEIGGFSKLFLLSPFTSLAAKLWLKCLENLRGALSSDLLQNLLQGLVDALRVRDPGLRINSLVNAIVQNVPANMNLPSAARNFLPQIGVITQSSERYESVAVVFPSIHIQFVAGKLGEKVCELLNPQCNVVLWMPYWDSNTMNQIYNAFSKGLSKRCSHCRVNRYHYTLGRGLAYARSVETIVNSILSSLKLSSDGKGAVVIAIDVPKILLKAMVDNILRKYKDRVSLFVASPRISFVDHPTNPHVKGVPIEFVRVV